VTKVRYYELISTYIRHRQRTDFDFWARTRGLGVSLPTQRFVKSQLYAVHHAGPHISHITARRQASKLPLQDANVSELLIGDRGYYLPFFAWLERLTDTTTSPALSQQEWWDSNGLAFRFMDLPSELRMSIYEQVVGPYTWPHTRGSPRSSVTAGAV
jgi:hypothetical protein